MNHTSAISLAVAGIPSGRILELEGYPDGSDAVAYVSGSVVTPLANPWSDIDVFVLTERRPIGPLALDAGPSQTSQHFVDGRRIDFEFWPPGHVRSLGERLDRLRIGSADYAPLCMFTYAEECFIHRLRIGVPILRPDGIQAVQRLFDFDKFGRYQAQEAIRQTDSIHEDVCGMLEAGHLDVAVLRARDLIGRSVDAYLHARGQTDPVVKWRPRHVRLSDDGSEFHRYVAATYWRLEFPTTLGPDAPAEAHRRYAEDCLAFSQRLISWIQS